MTASNNSDPRFLELASRFLDGAASPEELEALDAILKNDPSAVDTLAELLNQHGTLALSLRGEAAYRKQILGPGGAPPAVAAPAPARLAWWMAVPVAACIAVIVTVVLYKHEEPGARKAAPAAAPRSIAFQDGVAPTSEYRGTRDTKLAQRRPSQRFGRDALLEVEGGRGEGESSALVAWDLSQIPPGSQVLSAEITLSVSKSDEPGTVFQLWELRRAWSEGDANWNQARPGALWEGPGARGAGDRGREALARFQARNGVVTIPLGASGLAAISRWVRSPAENHGFVITYTGEGGEFYLASRESEVAAARPRLSVTFIPPEK